MTMLEPIDRKALVERHNVTLSHPGDKMFLQVGNGEFAYGMDLSGFQNSGGNLLAQWSWHTAPRRRTLRGAELRFDGVLHQGRLVPYPISEEGQPELFRYLRENPHRFCLGRLRLLLDGEPVDATRLTKPRQRLELWTGSVCSAYSLAGNPVEVHGCCHPRNDTLAIEVASPLWRSGRLAIELSFPYGDPGESGAKWDCPEKHSTSLERSGSNRGRFSRQLDRERYEVAWQWNDTALRLEETSPHTFRLKGVAGKDTICFTLAFSPREPQEDQPSYEECKKLSERYWRDFWRRGGAIDFSGSGDPRSRELERRIVLSQYLLAVNEAGSLPPQESGLYNDAVWYGKFHLEMHWWHGCHWALWNRWKLFERSLAWYSHILPKAEAYAKMQGYRGARWPKMIGPESGESPSPIGPLLIWQQPHPIFYAELDYMLHPGRLTLDKWGEIVFKTAEFLGSYATWEEAGQRYNLGPGLRTVPENNIPATTVNPAYELQAWRFGLKTALQWCRRLGIPERSDWRHILDHLPEFPQSGEVYLLQENLPGTFASPWNYEHPSHLGICGIFSGENVDMEKMRRTVRTACGQWRWNECWGWDFPMAAMAAARCGLPDLAVDFLLHPSPRNAFDAAGLNTGGPYPYFPANGGLLYAAAMMAAGWSNSEGAAPGFPVSWKVRAEGIHPAL